MSSVDVSSAAQAVIDALSGLNYNDLTVVSDSLAEILATKLMLGQWSIFTEALGEYVVGTHSIRVYAGAEGYLDITQDNFATLATTPNQLGVPATPADLE